MNRSWHNISNEITREYYYTLLKINPSRVYKVLRKNGSYEYFTYHINMYI